MHSGQGMMPAMPIHSTNLAFTHTFARFLSTACCLAAVALASYCLS
jgi:hypothetical protein